jgi:hypothetical protein
MNPFIEWYKEQYLIMRIVIWLVILLVLTSMVLWVTHTPSDRKKPARIIIACDPSRYSACR